MYLSTSTSTEDFPEMYLSTFQVLYKLYLSTDKDKVLLPGSASGTLSSECIWGTFFGNVELNWPKLFQAFFVKVTLIFYHECVHSIIPHQHMYKLCILTHNWVKILTFRSRKSISFSMLFLGIAKSTHYRSQIWAPYRHFIAFKVL